jgi:1-acyl-sn-glycerol-3-phosphate acyltransferase
MTVLRSTIFFLWFALASTVLSLLGVPALLLDRRVVVSISRTWSRATLWGLRVIAGLDYELRGPIPSKGVLVASKHMSMWDTIALYLFLDDPTVVMKRELLRIPFYGWMAWKAGVISIDRDGRALTLRHMVDQARRAIANGHAILIFPEGHRMAPGAAPDYKPGAAALYAQLDIECVPVALNSGLFWTGPMGFLKKRGRVIVQFLEPIPPGLRSRDFLERLQARIEIATAALLTEGREVLESGRANTLPANAAH